MIYSGYLALVASFFSCLLLGPEGSHAFAGSDTKISKPPSMPDQSSSEVLAITQPSTRGPKYVFRGDHKPPSEIAKSGIPPSMQANEVPDADAFMLLNHMDDAMDISTGLKNTAYVSTSTAVSVAVEFAQKKANTRLANAAGWVYCIRVTPNMVNLVTSVDPSRAVSHEREYSALGGIRPEDIVEAVRLPVNFFQGQVPEMEWGDLVRRLDEHWSAHASSEAWHWENENYRQSSDSAPRITGQPLLVGVQGPTDPHWQREPFRSIPPEDRVSAQEFARGFMQRAGAPDGWLPNYPLFDQAASSSGPLDEAVGFDLGALDLPEDYLEGLRDYRRRGIDCTALLASLLVLYPQKLHKKWLHRHEDACSEAKDVFRAARRDPCGRIHKLKVHFKLADQGYAGTWDIIKLALRASAKHRLVVPVADGPSRGFSVWKDIDLSKLTGSRDNTITPNQLTSIEVLAAGHASGPQNDQFKLQGITVRAKCVESDREIEVVKYAAQNTWYYHKPLSTLSERLLDQTVATFPILSADWRMNPPCEEFSQLNMFLGLEDIHWAGTYDSVSAYIGSQPLLFSTGPSAGFAKWLDVDLNLAFGKQVVPVRDVNHISLVDTAFGYYSEKDKWKYSEIKLQGTCAGSSVKAEIKVFNAENEWLQHGSGYGSDVVWWRKIRLYDWKQL
ncbi:putative enterotoxin [Ophiocordyceps australis]|uniref:Putative enterotoxin n=1 Tax=Ophiocordyceps australis TaxID=1399860 RepID=A0A2C5XRT6_9HYPO|nr:putative enterotoxin [Ophiocordyceps australis]